jgi:hypothetical protein
LSCGWWVSIRASSQSRSDRVTDQLEVARLRVAGATAEEELAKRESD